jgi:prophage regulatory protein
MQPPSRSENDLRDTQRGIVGAPRVFARLPTDMQATGLGRSTIYRMVASGIFPAPVQLGARAVAWRWSDLDRWSESRRGARRARPPAPRAGSRSGRAARQQANP